MSRSARAARISANELSHGNPLATAAGAAGGVIVNEGLHFAARKQSDKSYAAGYDKGKSDAVKQQYWLNVSLQQRPSNQVAVSACTPCNCPKNALTG